MRESYTGIELGVWSLTSDAVDRLKLNEDNVFDNEGNIPSSNIENIGEAQAIEAKVEIVSNESFGDDRKKSIEENKDESLHRNSSYRKKETVKRRYDWRDDERSEPYHFQD